HGQPVSGSRSAAMISISREMSLDGIMKKPLGREVPRGRARPGGCPLKACRDLSDRFPRFPCFAHVFIPKPVPTFGRHASEESLNSRLRPAEDQRMHVMRALIGVDGLQVLRVAHDVVLDLDAVAAMHVAGLPGDVERLAAIV